MIFFRFSQPKAFYFLSLSEIWERLSYYATRGLLVLYLTKFLLFTNQQAYALFAAFAALLYLTPVLGGHLADRLLGTKWAVILGGILSAIGYLCLALPDTFALYAGLSLVIIGNGFFLPNIANAVGYLYEENDSRRASAFSLFYTAINIGALLPPLFIGDMIHFLGWHVGFLISTISMLLGTILFYYSTRKQRQLAKVPNPFRFIRKKSAKINFLLISIIVCAAIFMYLLNHPRIANITLFSISAILILFTIKKSFKFSAIERNRIFICLLLTAFSVLFWVLSEQAAMSLTIFTEYNVHREFAHYTIPTIMFQALNPLTIILFGPLFAKMWMSLEKRNIHFSVPSKFALGTIFMGLGFVVLPLAVTMSSHTGQICFPWLVLSYVLQSIGELLLSPVGLSMITELSPKKIMGLMMGIWYFATAVANSFAGIVASFTTLPSNNNAPELTAPIFGHVFGMLGIIAIISGIIALFFVPLLKRILTSSPQLVTES